MEMALFWFTVIALPLAAVLAIKSYLPESKHGKRDDEPDKLN